MTKNWEPFLNWNTTKPKLLSPPLCRALVPPLRNKLTLGITSLFLPSSHSTCLQLSIYNISIYRQWCEVTDWNQQSPQLFFTPVLWSQPQQSIADPATPQPSQEAGRVLPCQGLTSVTRMYTSFQKTLLQVKWHWFACKQNIKHSKFGWKSV